MKNCPLCLRGELEYRTHEDNSLHVTSNVPESIHAWVCGECPFVGFEYYSHTNIELLKEILK